MKMKRFIAMLLAVVMTVGLLPPVAAVTEQAAMGQQISMVAGTEYQFTYTPGAAGDYILMLQSASVAGKDIVGGGYVAVSATDANGNAVGINSLHAKNDMFCYAFEGMSVQQYTISVTPSENMTAVVTMETRGKLTGISSDAGQLSCAVGETFAVFVRPDNFNAYEFTYTWSSSNDNVVKVLNIENNDHGNRTYECDVNLEGVGVGNATITVTAVDQVNPTNSFSCTIDVTVNTPVIGSSSILDEGVDSFFNLAANEKLTVEFTPDTTGYYWLKNHNDYGWSRLSLQGGSQAFDYDEGNYAGSVYYLNANQTYTFTENFEEAHSFAVTMEKADVATGLDFEKSAMTVQVGSLIDPHLVFTGGIIGTRFNIDNTNVTWQRDGMNAHSCRYLMIGSGTVVITATTVNNHDPSISFAPTCTVTVNPAAYHATVGEGSTGSVSLNAGDNAVLEFTPTTTGNYFVGRDAHKDMTYLVIDRAEGNDIGNLYGYYDADRDGHVYKLESGKLYWIVFTANQDLSSSFTVEKQTSSTGIIFNDTDLEVSGELTCVAEQTQTVYLTLQPAGAVDKLTFTSSDPTVAKVTGWAGNSFNIDTYKAGTTTITVTTAGGATRTLDVTVLDPNTVKNFTVDSVSMYQDQDTSGMPDGNGNMVQVYNPENKDPVVTIEFMDGRTFNCSWTAVESVTGLKMGHKNDLLTTAGWGLGSHSWTVTLNDQNGQILSEFEMTVTVEENPNAVKSFSVEPVTMLQDQETSEMPDGNGNMLKVYNPANKIPNVNIEFVDGRTVSCSWENVESVTGLKMGHKNDLLTTAGWGLGSHSWTVTLNDSNGRVVAETEMTVNVQENPIAAITAEAVTVTEGLEQYVTNDNGTNVLFYDVERSENVSFTIAFSNGDDTNVMWYDMQGQLGYHVESVTTWRDSATWTPGNSYTWTVVLKDDRGTTYATCDIPVTVEALQRDVLTLDTETPISMGSFENRILEFTATESGFLWLCYTDGYSSLVRYAKDADSEHYNTGYLPMDGKKGEYLEVKQGETYDLYISSYSDSIETKVTATMLSMATDITLETTEISGYVGEVIDIQYVKTPANSVAEISDASANDAIAELYTRSQERVGIMLNGVGTTTVTLTMGNVTKTIQVTVKQPPELILGQSQSLTLEPGQQKSYTFTPAVSGDYMVCIPYDAHGVNIWGKDIMEQEDGISGQYKWTRLGRLEANETYIVVLTSDFDESRTFDVIVGALTDVTSMTISGSAEMYENDWKELALSVNPMFSMVGQIQWSSSDPSVVEINYGHNSMVSVIARSAGTAVITAQNPDGITATFTVTVKEYGADAAGKWIGTGNGEQLRLSFTPETDGHYFLHTQNFDGWFYMDESSAVPDSNFSYDMNAYHGEVYEMKAGATYIFVSECPVAPDFEYKIFMSEMEMATSITITPSVTGKVHERMQIHVTADGAFQLRYSSSDESVVMVGGGSNDFQEIFLVGEGTAVVTATDQNGKTYTCNVTVSGEMGAEPLDGWTQVGLAAGDSHGYTFTPGENGLYWICTGEDSPLNISVGQSGGFVYSAEGMKGMVVELTAGTPVALTVSSNENTISSLYAMEMEEATGIELQTPEITGNSGEYADIRYWLYDDNNDSAVGQVTATSSDSSVVTVETVNGSMTQIKLVGSGEATVTIKVGNVEVTVPVTVAEMAKLEEGVDTPLVFEELGMDQFIQFTPANDGYYAFSLAAEGSAQVAVMGFWPEIVEPGSDHSLIVYLQAGETYDVSVILWEPTPDMTVVVKATQVVGPEALEITTLPTKQSYIEGALHTGLDLTGIVIEITWTDGTVTTHNYEELTQSDFMVNGFKVEPSSMEDTNGAGMVEVWCYNACDTYAVTLTPNPVDSIELIAPNGFVLPENTYGYEEDGRWIYSADYIRDVLKLKINYTDGTSVTVPASQAMLDGYSIDHGIEWSQMEQPWTKGIHTIEFDYLGHVAYYDLLIDENPIEKIELISGPTSQFYVNGGAYYEYIPEEDCYIFVPANYEQYKGLSFKVTYTDGTTETVTSEQFNWPYGYEFGWNIFGWYGNFPVETYVEAYNYGSYNPGAIVTGPTTLNMTLRYGWKTATYTVELLPAQQHEHDLTEVPAKAATCTEDGNIQHWTCSGCDVLFGDAEGERILTAEEIILTDGEHSYYDEWVPMIDYHCHKCEYCGDEKDITPHSAFVNKVELAYLISVNDCVEFYFKQCPDCGRGSDPDQVFTVAREDATHAWDEGTVTTPASCTAPGVTTFKCTNKGCEATKTEAIAQKTHNLSETKGKAATCTEDGNINFWTCNDCKTKFADAEGKTVITGTITLTKNGHVVSKVEAKAATCTEDGNVEYWICTACDHTFSDQAATTEITEVVIESQGHKLTAVEAKEATYTAPGNIAHWTCSGCDVLFGDAEGTTTVTDVVIPQLIKVEEEKAEVSEGAMDNAITEALKPDSGDSDGSDDSGDNETTETVKEVLLPVKNTSSENTVNSVSLPVASIEKIVETNEQVEEEVVLTIEMDSATVTLDSKALEAVAEQVGSSEVTLKVEEIQPEDLNKVQQNIVKSQKVEMVISAELVGGDTSVHDFGGGTVTVKLPFNPPAGTKGNDYKILYVADNGRIEMIKTTYVDAHLVFTLTHFSEYIVVNEKVAEDVTNPEANTPPTGDSTDILLLTFLMFAAAASMAVLEISKKRYAR